MKRAPATRIIVALIVFAGAVTFAATRVSFLQSDARSSGAAGRRAPAFTGIERWLNSEPLTIEALRGKVVWVDFWTFSCINCIRTLPAVRAIYARYKPFGLEVVGVHSPEFDFERSADNVRAAIARHKIPYPVALDNEMDTWRAYGNNYWPHVYLVDARGTIRFDRIGEGSDEDLQREVRKLLTETGADLPPAIDLETQVPSPHITPEIYAGFERGEEQGFLQNRQGFVRDAPGVYGAPTATQVEDAGRAGAFFLGGRWTARSEYVEADEDGARVILPFYARDVFMVASGGRGPVVVDTVLDGKAGRKISVEREDLFSLVAAAQPEAHVLTIVVPEGFRLYTFTFG